MSFELRNRDEFWSHAISTGVKNQATRQAGNQPGRQAIAADLTVLAKNHAIIRFRRGS